MSIQRYAVIETALCIGGDLHDGEVLMVRADDHDRELSALREELANHISSKNAFAQNAIDLQKRAIAAEQRNVTLSDALIKIIEMNRQHAKDQYGDPDKAESWACIRVSREALETKNAES
jgi:hypothetical protein